jgi:hypothetical protein
LCTLSVCCVHSQSVVYTLSLLCTLSVCCVHSQTVVYTLSLLCTLSVCCVHWSRKVRLSSSAPQHSTKVVCHVELIFHVIMSRLKPISLSNFISPTVENPSNDIPTPAIPPVTGWRGNYGPVRNNFDDSGFSVVGPTLPVSAAVRKRRRRSTPRTISAVTSSLITPPLPSRLSIPPR